LRRVHLVSWREGRQFEVELDAMEAGHQENHFYPGTNMFVSFFPGFHKASQDVLGQPELSWGNLNCPEIT
jgi:hypothetical protein